MENPLPFSKEDIERVYRNLRVWEYLYRHVNTLASSEEYPAHAKSVLVRLEGVREAVHTLEGHWGRLGVEYAPIKKRIMG